MAFADILELWKAYGVFEFYLPFVLMFAIFYGLLAKSKIFGDESKERRVRNINVVISIVAALFVMVSPVGVSLTTFFGTFFTQTMVVLTTMLSFLLIMYMVIPHGSVDDMLKEPMKYAKFLIPFAVLAALALFFASGAPEIFGIKVGGAGNIGLPGLNLTSQDTITIAMILLFLLIVVYMARGEEKVKGKNKGGQGPSYEVEGTKYSA